MESNTLAVDYRSGMEGDNAGMEKADIKTIRLRNLEIILEEEFGGVKADLARAAGVAPNNISRYFSTHPRDGRRVSDDMARSLEEATGKPYGWMDRIHQKVDLNAEAAGLPEEKLEMLRAFIRTLKEGSR